MTTRGEDLLGRLRKKAAARGALPAPAAGSRKTPAASPALPALFELAISRPTGAVPQHMLFVRPDSYGDLVLFEPVLRGVRAAFPSCRISVLARNSHLDIAPLFPAGIVWHGFKGDPFLQTVDKATEQVDQLIETMRRLAPDVLVAPCFNKTWVEAVCAVAVPQARRVTVGATAFDLITTNWLQGRLPQGTPAYAEIVEVASEAPEVEKGRLLLAHLTGAPSVAQAPELAIPPGAAKAADRFLSGHRLTRGRYILCAPAGTANVAIKAWPADRFANVVAAVAAKHRLAVLIVGSAAEKSVTDDVLQRVRAKGIRAEAWNGRPGEIATLASLADGALLYFGNDTGAMHMAAARQKPVAAIFGGGHGPRFMPVTPKGIVFVHPLPCFGCGWDCHLGDAPCVRLISDEVVARRLQGFVGGLRQHKGVEVVELTSLSPTILDSVGSSRRIFDNIQRDREARMKQILELTSTVHHLESTAREQHGAGTLAAQQAVEGEAKVSAAASEAAGLRTALNQLQADHARLREQVATIPELERGLRERDAAVLQATERVAALDRSRAEIEQAWQQAQHELQQATAGAQGWQAQQAEVNAQLAVLRKERDQLQKNVAAERQKASRLAELAQHRASELDRLGAATAEQSQAAQSLESAAAQARTEVAVTAEALTRVQAELVRLRLENADLTQAREAARQSAATAATTTSELIARVGQAEARCAELQAALGDRERRLAEVQSEMQDTLAEFAQTRDRGEALAHVGTELRVRIDELNAAITTRDAQLQQQVQRAAQELAQMHEQHDALRSAADTAARRSSEQASALKEAGERADVLGQVEFELRAHIDELRATINAREAQFQHQAETAARELAQALEQRDALGAAAETAARESSEQAAELAQMRARLAELGRVETEQRSHIEELTAANTVHEAQMRELAQHAAREHEQLREQLDSLRSAEQHSGARVAELAQTLETEKHQAAEQLALARDQLTELTATGQAQRAHLDELKAEIIARETRLAGLQQQEQATAHELSGLRGEHDRAIAAHQAAASRAEARIQELEQARSALNAALETEKRQAADQLAQARDRGTELTATGEAQRVRLDQLAAAIADRDARLADLHAQSYATGTELAQLQAHYDDLLVRSQTAATQADRRIAELEAARSDLASALETERHNAADQLAEARDRVAELTATGQAQRARLDELLAEVVARDARLDQGQARIQSAENDLAVLRARHESLVTQASEAADQARVSEIESEAARDRMRAELETERHKAANLLAEARSRVAELTATSQAQRARLDELLAEVVARDARLDQGQARIQSAENDLALLRARHESVVTQASEAADQARASEIESEAARDHLRAELETERRDNSALLAQTRERVAELTTTGQTLRSRLDELTAEIVARDVRLASLQAQHHTTAQELAQVRALHDSLLAQSQASALDWSARHAALEEGRNALTATLEAERAETAEQLAQARDRITELTANGHSERARRDELAAELVARDSDISRQQQVLADLANQLGLQTTVSRSLSEDNLRKSNELQRLQRQLIDQQHSLLTVREALRGTEGNLATTLTSLRALEATPAVRLGRRLRLAPAATPTSRT